MSQSDICVIQLRHALRAEAPLPPLNTDDLEGGFYVRGEGGFYWSWFAATALERRKLQAEVEDYNRRAVS